MWNHGVRFLGAFVEEATSKLLGSELDAPLFAPLLLMHTSSPCFRPSSLGKPPIWPPIYAPSSCHPWWKGACLEAQHSVEHARIDEAVHFWDHFLAVRSHSCSSLWHGTVSPWGGNFPVCQASKSSDRTHSKSFDTSSSTPRSLDVAVLRSFRCEFERQWNSARSAAPQGELSKIAWLGAVVRTVENVVRSRDWRHAFLKCGVLGKQAHVSQRLLKSLSWQTLPPIGHGMPGLSQMWQMFPRKRKRLNVPAIVQWSPDMHSCPAKPVETWDWKWIRGWGDMTS